MSETRTETPRRLVLLRRRSLPRLWQRRDFRSGFSMFLARSAFLAIMLVLWEFLSGTLIDSFFISDPLAVFDKLKGWIEDGTLLSNARVTFIEAGVGFAIGVVIGVVLGFALGLNAWIANVTRPFIFALYSLPKLALAPLFLIWFGIGIEMKAALAATTVFFLVFFNTYSGVLDADKWLVNILRLMGASKIRIVRMALIPGTLPAIILGIKIALPYALVGAVVGELISSNEGLGYLIQSSAAQFDTAGTFAGLVVIGVIAVALSVLLEYAETKLLRWKSAGVPGGTAAM